MCAGIRRKAFCFHRQDLGGAVFPWGGHCRGWLGINDQTANTPASPYCPVCGGPLGMRAVMGGYQGLRSKANSSYFPGDWVSFALSCS